jgi:hypothetical protein
MAESDAYKPSLFKRALRISIAGVMFGFPLGSLVIASPLLRLLVNKESMAKAGPNMQLTFGGICCAATALSYALTVEWGQDNRFALGGFLPYVSPLRGAFLTLSGWAVSHLYFPGYMACLYEPRETRWQVYTKLTLKCMVAYFPQHGFTAISVGLGVGFLLWPFMIYKDSKEAKRRIVSLPPVIKMEPSAPL